MAEAPYRLDVITLTPDIWPILTSEASGLVGRAFLDGTVQCQVTHLRDYGKGVHRQVDDTPFGGGPGMLISPVPTRAALDDVRRYNEGPVVMLSPRGERFTQSIANELAAKPGIIFLCGRYEGFDERVRMEVDYDLSIGDFVLSGGDPAAWCMADAIIRRLPRVLGNEESIVDESFANQTLEYPQFTRPASFDGHDVPEILRSGNHRKIAEWRTAQAQALTKLYRPDLISGQNAGPELKDLDGREWRESTDHPKASVD